MQNAINDQINAELWSAYLYLSMAMDAESKMLKGIANWFFIQWLEEQDHARIFQNYLNDHGAKVRLQPIDGVQENWPSPLVMYQDTLEHEKEVTAMIENLVRVAMNEGDFATLSRLQWFVDEQIEEEKNSADIIVLLERADKDMAFLHKIDDTLAQRRYEKPDVLPPIPD